MGVQRPSRLDFSSQLSLPVVASRHPRPNRAHRVRLYVLFDAICQACCGSLYHDDDSHFPVRRLHAGYSMVSNRCSSFSSNFLQIPEIFHQFR